jgi:hypothetical protein
MASKATLPRSLRSRGSVKDVPRQCVKNVMRLNTAFGRCGLSTHTCPRPEHNCGDALDNFRTSSTINLRTSMPTPFAIFFFCWAVLGIGCWIFYTTASYETKKFAHPFIAVGAGIIFLTFVEWTSQGNIPWFFVIAVVLITFLNIRNIQFCPQCNATLYGRGFSRSKFCSKCGTELS